MLSSVLSTRPSGMFVQPRLTARSTTSPTIGPGTPTPMATGTSSPVSPAIFSRMFSTMSLAMLMPLSDTSVGIAHWSWI